MKLRKLLGILLGLLLPLLFIPSPAFAQCVPTAIGCIPTNASAFATWLAQKTVLLAALGGMLFLIIGGLEILTSTGDPEKLMMAKKRVTAAISGLLFILLSVLILNIMGVRIIDIPGWIYTP